MNRPLTRKNFFTDGQINFQVYGVKVGVKAERKSYLEAVFPLLKKIYTGGLETVAEREIEYQFYIKRVKSKGFELYRNDELVLESQNREIFFDAVESSIRVTIAEYARAKVFLHAGVVGWKGRAIIIPGRSYAGKSTLVAELVKKGALYYSDEYAVLDAEGNVQPFPKWLSLRGIIDSSTQLDCSVESLGGIAGSATISAGMILLMQYDENAQLNSSRWQPERLSAGQGVMEILPHTLPIRNKPKFVLEVLNKLTTRAIIVKTVRGDAKEFATMLLDYFEHKTDLGFQRKDFYIKT